MTCDLTPFPVPLPDGDRVIIYRQQYFGFFTLPEHTELTLSLETSEVLLSASFW